MNSNDTAATRLARMMDNDRLVNFHQQLDEMEVYVGELRDAIDDVIAECADGSDDMKDAEDAHDRMGDLYEAIRAVSKRMEDDDTINIGSHLRDGTFT